MSVVRLPKLVLAEFEQALAVMFLHANQHNYSRLLQPPPRDLAPWQVRQAEEYIEANWQRAIVLEDLVDVTGVSAVELFRSFKKCRGYSPMEFANRVRLVTRTSFGAPGRNDYGRGGRFDLRLRRSRLFR